MLDRDMTPAQKAARTRAVDKIWEEHAKRTQPTEDAYWAVADTLIPERNRIIDEAEAKRDRIIAEAEAQYEAIRKVEMDKYQEAMAVLEAERQKARNESFNIVIAETAKYTNNSEGVISGTY